AGTERAGFGLPVRRGLSGDRPSLHEGGDARRTPPVRFRKSPHLRSDELRGSAGRGRESEGDRRWAVGSWRSACSHGDAAAETVELPRSRIRTVRAWPTRPLRAPAARPQRTAADRPRATPGPRPHRGGAPPVATRAPAELLD